jgi:glutamate dehydrogenase/leucine dehydrogenase
VLARPIPPPRSGDGAPARIIEVREHGGILGALVIDRLVAGRACGGVRVGTAVTVGELRQLAAVMTRKFAFFGIACGGAKAGLSIPPGTTRGERERLTRTFGRALAPLVRTGAYVAATDLGCQQRDLWALLDAAGIASGPTPAEAAGSTTADHAGRSAAIAALAGLASRRRPVAGARLVVPGYGRVGAALALRFAAAGGRLIAVSTALGAVADPHGLDVERLESLRARYGDAAPLRYGGATLPAEDVLAVPTDVLAPCAGTDVVDGGNWRRIRCAVVAPGANAPLTHEAETGLSERGVLVLPDFVANAGAVLVGHFWPLPLSSSTVDHLLEGRFRRIVERLLREAARARLPPAVLARALAEQNLGCLEAASAAARRHERWLATLCHAPIRRALPAVVVGAVVRYVARRLGPPTDHRV